MSQTPYYAVSQGPATIPMQNYGEGQRIMPPPQGWCTPRRTKIIIAIVILTILFIVTVIGYAVLKVRVEEHRYHY